MGLLEIIYVVIMILLAIGSFGSIAQPNSFGWWGTGGPFVYFLLFLIIGLVLFSGTIPIR